MAAYLFVDFDVSEDGVDAPRFGEHGAEGEREARHEKPRSPCANVGEEGDRGQLTVQPQENDTHVGEHAAHDDQVVQVRTGHFDIPETRWQQIKNA